MINADATDPAAQPRASLSLFEAVAFPGGAYCEGFSSPTTTRGHWQSLVAALNAMGPDLLDQRQERAGRMRHEDGATFNPFNDPSGRGTPWALEIIPLPLTAGDWADLEDGLTQRALLLEKIVADIYGPQNLMKDGWIPPELVFANPHFLRPCHGIQPTADRFLVYYAADLYRGVDGRFRVLRDFGANPAGLGYALENRIVISRIFPELYHKTQIRRLAPFFQSFHRSLIQRASQRGNDPSIVLLSPGPESRIYFEHALLSRYLGYPLVEGQDLTVRNGKVFLKKLAGLEPVASVVRLTEDMDSDPIAFRRQTAAGVAGLIQVSREQHIDIVNPIGSGFVDTPALSVFLPALCRQLMGEELLLENHPAWWCGSADERNHVLANMEQLVAGPAMDRSMAAGDRDALVTAILAEPYRFMAREPLCPAAVPAWSQGGVSSRYTLMRVFACATDHGFTVMPGGLAVTAADVKTLTEDCLERQLSKDIWVLSDQPVEPFSLMGGLQVVAAFRRGNDLPSRVADHLLWLGRYLERAEGLVRLLRSVYRRLSGEARPGDIAELPFLLNLLRAGNSIPQAVDNGESIPLYRELAAQLEDALYRQDRPESVIAVFKRVQMAARQVRDRLSLDSWRVINRLEGFADQPVGDPLEHLDNTLFTLSAFSGLAMESMTRGLGWRFMDMGRRVERALNQTGLIRVGLPQICSESRSILEALLEVFDSIMTYRARYRTTFQLAPVLDLLLVDESNPKSLAFQVNQLAVHVADLPRQSDPPDANLEARTVQEMLSAVRQVDLSGLRCDENGATTESLNDFLESMQTCLKAFTQQVTAHFLSRVPATPHFSMISGDRKP
jgi:uncharacterized circularly permuted ATP-grasp superfamily protein/uncharacterized alpha-E superfamily protein